MPVSRFGVFLLLLSVMVSSGPARGYDDIGTYVPKLPLSCASLLQADPTDGQDVLAVYYGWMAGYMTRVNERLPGKSDHFGPLADELEWIRSWCRDNPSEDFEEAMHTLTDTRLGKNHRNEAEVFFDNAACSLDSATRQALDRHAAQLRAPPTPQIVIEGHCHTSETREYNLALSERCAQVIKEYLVSRGLDPARTKVLAYGKELGVPGKSSKEAGCRTIIKVLNVKPR